MAVGDYAGQEGYAEGDALSFTASSAVSAGEPVAVDGDLSVAPAGSASAVFDGIAGHAADAGEMVDVKLRGAIFASATSTVAAGDFVEPDGAGSVQPLATADTQQVNAAKALTAADADGVALVTLR